MDDYYYGVGRVRALEARLVTFAQLTRMAAAPDFGSAFRILSETPYAESLAILPHPFDFEELFKIEREKLHALLRILAPNSEVINVILGKQAYQEKKMALILESQSDPHAAALAVDKEYFAKLKSACERSSSRLVKEWAYHQIDLINLKIILRLREAKKEKKAAEAALLETGFIDKDLLLELYDKGPAEMIARLSHTPYFPFISEGVEKGDVSLLEKLMDDFIITRFMKAKYLSSGVEPLVGFYLAKENEMRTIRFILIGKKNFVEAERIRGRLRVTYA